MEFTIKEIICRTPYLEDKKTQILLEEFHDLKKIGYYNKKQALKVLKWKSPRPTRYYELNTEEDFINITSTAFKQHNEKLKIHILTALEGVNYPSASALLMFYDQKYPVLDIRVWRQLYRLGSVNSNPKGKNFTLNQWSKYLEVINILSKEFKINQRQIEKQIFDYDKISQIGLLYK
ncbi:hypothetical protein [Celeribacter sp.]|uniref:hypothetical protein n=1 Tax=Celeribacter sp. TaxID=1890673 RepID=UPI003A9341B1